MKRIDTIVGSLRENGYRISKGRKGIIEVLLKAKQPLAPLELHELLMSSRTPVDKVTVYRELKFLSGVGVVQSVHLKDTLQRYEIAPEKGHKHHLVCTSCKTVKDVQMKCEDLHSLEKNIGQKNQFSIRGHSLEFYGVCAKCV